jgi:hypothetical protein
MTQSVVAETIDKAAQEAVAGVRGCRWCCDQNDFCVTVADLRLDGEHSHEPAHRRRGLNVRTVCCAVYARLVRQNGRLAGCPVAPSPPILRTGNSDVFAEPSVVLSVPVDLPIRTAALSACQVTPSPPCSLKQSVDK